MDEASAREVFSCSEGKSGSEAGIPVPEMLERESQEVSAAMAAFRREVLLRLDPEGAIWPLPPPEGKTEDGQSRVRPRPGAKRVGFSPFYYYPFLFASAFPGADVERLRLLARANRFLLEAVLVLDSRMDTDRPVDPVDLHLLEAHYHRAMEILVPVLPPDSEFWLRCRDLYIRYGRSVLREILFHRFRLAPYPVEEFKTISAGKAALLQTTVLALCAWTGSEQYRSALEASQEAFLCGFQAIDDLKDWREDYARQNFTYLLTRVLKRAGWVREVELGCGPSVEDVGRALHFHGSAQEQLDLAEALFQEASRAVSSVPVPLWKEVLEAYLAGTRAMKADMAEIRRRERIRAARVCASRSEKGSGHGASLQRIEECARRGIRFLAESQQAGGAFRLAVSPNGYMRPSRRLGSSRAATEFVTRSLAVLEGAAPEASDLRERAAAWLQCGSFSEEEWFQNPLERAFGADSAEDWVRAAQAYLDTGRVEDAMFPLPEEALVAELLYRTASGKIAWPGLDLSLFQRGLGGRWGRTEDLGAADIELEKRGFLRPLLVSYLFSRAWEAWGEAGSGPALATLGDRVVAEGPQIAQRAHLTDVALALACLARSGGPTERIVPLVERLVWNQEVDGSWPPNAFYVRGLHCYGSRDVTTAWCLEALVLCLKALPRGGQDLGRVRPAPTECEPVVTIELHAGVSPDILPNLKKEAGRCALWLPLPGAIRMYVGRWESMASRFVTLREGQPILGLQTDGSGVTGCSAAKRPLEAELALGWVEAAWKLLGRPLGSWKERLFVGGLGMMLCRRLWPSREPWAQAGLSRLDWRWCRENEWFLREGMRRLWYGDARGGDSEIAPEGALALDRKGLAEKVFLYLGLRLFDGECKRGGLRGDFRAHLEESGMEIDRRISSLWGDAKAENTCRVGKRRR